MSGPVTLKAKNCKFAGGKHIPRDTLTGTVLSLWCNYFIDGTRTRQQLTKSLPNYNKDYVMAFVNIHPSVKNKSIISLQNRPYRTQRYTFAIKII